MEAPLAFVFSRPLSKVSTDTELAPAVIERRFLRKVQNSGRAYGCNIALVQRLAVAFRANRQCDDSKEPDLPKVHHDVCQTVSFE